MSECIHTYTIGTTSDSDSSVHVSVRWRWGGGGARGPNLEHILKLYFLYFSVQPFLEIIHTLTIGTL